MIWISLHQKYFQLSESIHRLSESIHTGEERPPASTSVWHTIIHPFGKSTKKTENDMDFPVPKMFFDSWKVYIDSRKAYIDSQKVYTDEQKDHQPRIHLFGNNTAKINSQS